MSHILGRLMTFCGCMLSLASFCFLPYLVYTSSAFTGFQLLFLGSQIPLPHAFVLENIPAVLQNDPLVWKLLGLLVLTGFLAVAGLWPNQRLAKIVAWGIIIGVGFTVVFSLCSAARDVAAGLDFVDAHANTLRGRVYGSLSIGFLGIWLGMLIALIGSVITLRSRD